MNLQFFHVHDLCLFMDILLEQKPKQHIFNVGNAETITVRDWVSLCYQTAGKLVSFIEVNSGIEQRKYFSFYDYDYRLDIRKQKAFMPVTKTLEEGLQDSFAWYLANSEKVNRKPFIDYIDEHLAP